MDTLLGYVRYLEEKPLEAQSIFAGLNKNGHNLKVRGVLPLLTLAAEISSLSVMTTEAQESLFRRVLSCNNIVLLTYFTQTAALLFEKNGPSLESYLCLNKFRSSSLGRAKPF